VEKHYGGTAPDAGIWTPEHAAFLGRLETRLAEIAGSLGQDGYSLNQAARTLIGIVEDALRFSRIEGTVDGLPEWRDETRTAIALELAAAKLLATCAAPVMPRFAGRLGEALGLNDGVSRWPHQVTLMPPGSSVDLARQVFFGPPEPPSSPAAESPEPDWLADLVRQTLQLPAGTPVAGATLVSLGAESMQAIAIQYQILAGTGADVAVADLLGDRTVAQLAALLPAAAEERVIA
jgi:methionyl-tRNA synthetase